MESSGFRYIFTVAFDHFRLGNVNDCPAGLEPPAGEEVPSRYFGLMG